MHETEMYRLGCMPYQAAWDLQERVFEDVRTGKRGDVILVLEHPHTYTFGKNSHKENLLFTPSELQVKGIEVFDINRGGDVTYHGPGQFVAYPILNMHRYYLDIHRYLRDLEEVVIGLLADFGIAASRKAHGDPKKNYTGVWVGEEKICAMGVRFSHWTTMHGLALNVNTDLAYFSGIVPCGITDKRVTSMQMLLGKTVLFSSVETAFKTHFENVFGVSIVHGLVGDEDSKLTLI